MWEGMDRAAIEAVLGRGVTWMEDEDAFNMTHLIDKSIREGGLSAAEQTEYDALQALYCCGM